MQKSAREFSHGVNLIKKSQVSLIPDVDSMTSDVKNSFGKLAI